jgi:O-antigen/teichoic acid export membrane protein
MPFLVLIMATNQLENENNLDHKDASPIKGVIGALAGDAFVYMLGAAAMGLGNVILIPLYVRSLTVSEFAVFSLIELAILFSWVIAQMGLVSAYLKWFADTPKSEHSALLGSSLIYNLATSVFAGLLLWFVISTPLGMKWVGLDRQDFLWLLPIIVILESLQNIIRTDFRARRMPIAFAGTAMVRLALLTAVTYVFLVYLNLGLYGIFLGRVIGNLGSMALLMGMEVRHIRWDFRWDWIRQMAKFGAPVIVSASIAVLLDANGRYFLNFLSSLEQVGYYSAAVKISSIFTMLIAQPFGTAWGGLTFQIARKEHARLLYSKITGYVATFAITMATALALLSPILAQVFLTSEYLPALTVLPLILLVRSINMLEFISAVGLYLSHKTQAFVWIYLLALGANLGVNYFLIPPLGMNGAVLAWLVGWILAVFLIALMGQRYYRFSYEWRFLFVPLLIWAVVFFIPLPQTFEISWGEIGMRFLGSFLLIVGIGAWLGFDIMALRAKLQKPLPEGAGTQ